MNHRSVLLKLRSALHYVDQLGVTVRVLSGNVVFEEQLSLSPLHIELRICTVAELLGLLLLFGEYIR